MKRTTPPVQVTRAELDELLKASARSGFEAMRAKMFLTVASGVSLTQTAVELGLERKAVSRAVRDWKQRRLRALHDQRGDHRIDLRQLVALLRSPPPSGPEWKLRELAERLGVATTSVSQVFIQRGIPWKSP